MFDVLFPPGRAAAADALLEVGSGRRVLLNMVATIDGHVTREGGSTQLGGDGDRELFFALRGIVDGVLAGTGTLGSESYGRLIATPERRAARESRGLAADAALLVITRSGEVPWDAPLFAEPEQRVLIAGPARVPAGVRARVEVFAADGPRAALDGFAARGVERVLCEGGPGLNRALLAERLVDELFVTVDASLSGGEGLRMVEGDALRPVPGARLLWVLRRDDELYLRYEL